MGEVYIAECECGFKSDGLYLGGGMMSSDDCHAPAICLTCSSFTVMNYADDNPECPECRGKGKVVFYNDIEVQAEDELKRKHREIFSWNISDNKSFKLNDIHYLCPSCGKLKMKFASIGSWD